MTRLSEFYSDAFHGEFCQVAFETGKLLTKFSKNENEVVFIDAKNFPQVSFEIISLKQVVERVEEKDFPIFLEAQNGRKDRKIIYYLYEEGLFFRYINSSYFEEYVFDDVESPRTLANFVLAYKGGLVKELYSHTDSSGDLGVFAVIDNEVKIFKGEEIFNFFDTDGEGFIDFEHWSAICVENTDSLVSYLFIDSQNHKLWYGTLDEDFEQKLRQYMTLNTEASLLEDENEDEDGADEHGTAMPTK